MSLTLAAASNTSKDQALRRCEALRCLLACRFDVELAQHHYSRWEMQHELEQGW